LNRELDPEDLKEEEYTILSDTWSDCDGDEIYGDYTISGGNFAEARSFEPGMATVDPWTDGGGDDTESIIKVWHEFLYEPTPIFNSTVQVADSYFVGQFLVLVDNKKSDYSTRVVQGASR
jgi:hypothetical protein